jgi:hypothetical protein
MKKLVTVVLGLVLLATVAGLGVAQVAKQGMPGQPALPGARSVDVKLTDAKGQPVRIESLPPEAQAQVARVRKAAESMVGPAGTAERLKITVGCSWPPLKCTITVEF